MKILVGVDESDSAARAATASARLAHGLGAELHVISAFGHIDVQKVRVEGRELETDHEGLAFAAAERARDRLAEEFPGLDVSSASVEGKPAEALVRLAEELGADIIVVGNKRVQGLARVLGSIATDVAHKAPCDVYIVHTHQ